MSQYYFSRRKRLFDISVALVVLGIFWPILVVLITLIYIFSGAPVFFVQIRQGKNKRPFTMIKLRTMSIDAEKQREKLAKNNQAPAPMFKMDHDPRHTAIGRFLSRTGLDELPQFFHVLAGQMSIVGPRPLPMAEAALLPKNWDFRYSVRPGIISLWAVSSERFASLKRWRELEVETLRQWSLLNDIRLVFQTWSLLFETLFVKQ